MSSNGENSNRIADNNSDEPVKKPACKACCACPETKQARDKW